VGTVSIPAGSFKPPPPDVASCMPSGSTFYALLPDYETLILALEKKRLERNVSFKTLAEAASLQPAFVSGAMGPSRTRRFGWLSIFLMAPVLGLRVAFLDDPEMASRYADELEPRHANQARPNNYASPPGTRTMSRVFKHIAKNGGKARMRKMTKAERCEHQSRASNARWRKFRRTRKTSPRDDGPHPEIPA
jgi:hypothetical protein